MKCSKCGKKAATNFRHLSPLCKSCFSGIIERRIRRNLRKNLDVKKDNRILVMDPVSEHFVKRIIKAPVEIVKKPYSFLGLKKPDSAIFENRKLKEFVKKNSIKKIIIPWTLEQELELFMNDFIEQRTIKENKKFTKLFVNVLEDELANFLKFKNLRFAKKKHSDFVGMLDKVEERYPGTKFSMLKSVEELRNI